MYKAVYFAILGHSELDWAKCKQNSVGNPLKFKFCCRGISSTFCINVRSVNSDESITVKSIENKIPCWKIKSYGLYYVTYLEQIQIPQAGNCKNIERRTKG